MQINNGSTLSNILKGGSDTPLKDNEVESTPKAGEFDTLLDLAKAAEFDTPLSLAKGEESALLELIGSDLLSEKDLDGLLDSLRSGETSIDDVKEVLSELEGELKTDSKAELKVELKNDTTKNKDFSTNIFALEKKAQLDSNFHDNEVPLPMKNNSPRLNQGRAANIFSLNQNENNDSLISLKKNSEISSNDSGRALSLEEAILGQPVTAKEGAGESLDFSMGKAKVINLSSASVKNPQALISEISNYVEQSRVQGLEKVDLVVNHQELGQFKVQVNQTKGQSNVDLQIMTTTKEGSEFFAKHESDLIKSLNSAGIKLADMKLVTSNRSDFSMGADSQGKDQSSKDWTGHSSERSQFSQNERSDEGNSKRRQNLWKQYQEQLGA